MDQRNTLSRGLIRLCLGLILFFGTVAFATEVPKISTEELRSMLGNPDVIIIDLRGGGGARIQGAIRKEPQTVSSWMDKYPKDKTLVFYCA